MLDDTNYSTLTESCRFQLWISTLRATPLDIWIHWVQQDLPPLDVLMVWHAYMLDAKYGSSSARSNNDLKFRFDSWYEEDIARIELLKPLAILKDRLLTTLVSE